MADRYFLPRPLAPGLADLDGDEARHLVRVARRQVGDVVEVFDGRGHGARARVVSTGREATVLEILDPVPDRATAVALTLAVAVPKGDRMDWLVEKATELGVGRLVPLRSERSVVDPRNSKLERLRRVVVEASKQCGRNRFMTLDGPMSLDEYLRKESADHRLFAHAGGAGPGLWPAIGPGQSVAVAIGPEGGWTELEVEDAARRDWARIGLGPTRLRVETAAIVAAAAVFSRIEERQG